MTSKLNLLLWIGIALVLTVLFNIYPRLSTYPDVIAFPIGIAIGVIMTRLKPRHQGADVPAPYLSISPLVFVGGALMIAGPLWFATLAQIFGNPGETKFIAIYIAPALLLLFTGIVCLVYGLVRSRRLGE